MKILGFEITRTKAAPPAGLRLPDTRGGWYPVIREGFAGAWQQNVETPLVDVLSHPTTFACVTLIAGDFAKTRTELTKLEADDVWVPTSNPAFSPVLRRQNGYQTTFQFQEQWMISKQESGNTYVLKARDARGVVVALYILDPWRVRPLIAPDGSVFYELNQDPLAAVSEQVLVPAREVIHDRFNCLFHPLVGISPLYAAGLPSILGLRILKNSTNFFGNASIPSGIIKVPGALDQAAADDAKAKWNTNYGGNNTGQVALLADGMTFETISQPADKAQLNEQWNAASQAIAVAFHVPFYLVGGPMPPYNNIQALNVQYYTQCLQPLFKSYEDCMDDGLGLRDTINGTQYGVQLRTKDLLLMDTISLMESIAKGIGAGVLKPNEGRADLNLLPVTGGDTPYMQQQNFSLEALAEQSVTAEAATPAAAPAVPEDDPAEDDNLSDGDMAAAFSALMRKELDLVAA